MDSRKLTSLVVAEMNDAITVREYSHGFLMVLPLTYWDDDSVTLFIEPFAGGYRVTDRGATAVRLQMTGMNVAATKVAESWRRSVSSLNLFNPENEELELAHFSDAAHLGESILDVAQASLRIDQLRWLYTPHTPVRFSDRIVRRLAETVGDTARVTPNASMRLRHGRQRQVTAAVALEDDQQIYVQAVNAGTRDTRERAVEHCAFLFHYADNLPRERRLAVAAGRRADWSEYFIDTLAETAEVAFFDEPGELDETLHRRLAQVRPGRPATG